MMLRRSVVSLCRRVGKEVSNIVKESFSSLLVKLPEREIAVSLIVHVKIIRFKVVNSMDMTTLNEISLSPPRSIKIQLENCKALEYFIQLQQSNCWKGIISLA